MSPFLLVMLFLVTFCMVFSTSLLTIGVFCLSISMLVCAVVGILYSSWYAFITMIVYVGGLLVMFSYFLAICPNQHIKMQGKAMPFVFSFFLLMIYYGFESLSVDSLSDQYWGGSTSFFYEGSNSFLVFAVLMLLLALISVVKVVQVGQGPLRPFNEKV